MAQHTINTNITVPRELDSIIVALQTEQKMPSYSAACTFVMKMGITYLKLLQDQEDIKKKAEEEKENVVLDTGETQE